MLVVSAPATSPTVVRVEMVLDRPTFWKWRPCCPFWRSCGHTISVELALFDLHVQVLGCLVDRVPWNGQFALMLSPSGAIAMLP